MFRHALIACLVVTVLAGCGGGPSLFGPSTGTVSGHVQLRVCGGAYLDGQTACPTHPYAGLTLTFTPLSGTDKEQSATTDSRGSYHIDLKPATYTVRASTVRASARSGQAGALGGPRQVVVTAGKTVTADFVYTINLL